MRPCVSNYFGASASIPSGSLPGLVLQQLCFSFLSTTSDKSLPECFSNGARSSRSLPPLRLPRLLLLLRN